MRIQPRSGSADHCPRDFAPDFPEAGRPNVWPMPLLEVLSCSATTLETAGFKTSAFKIMKTETRLEIFIGTFGLLCF